MIDKAWWVVVPVMLIAGAALVLDVISTPAGGFSGILVLIGAGGLLTTLVIRTRVMLEERGLRVPTAKTWSYLYPYEDIYGVKLSGSNMIEVSVRPSASWWESYMRGSKSSYWRIRLKDPMSFLDALSERLGDTRREEKSDGTIVVSVSREWPDKR